MTILDTMYVNTKLEIHTPGVDYGPMTLHHIHWSHDEPKYLVLKTASHKSWSGRGYQRTIAAHFTIAEVVSYDLNAGRFEVVRPLRFDVRGPSQVAMLFAKQLQEAQS